MDRGRLRRWQPVGGEAGRPRSLSLCIPGEAGAVPLTG